MVIITKIMMLVHVINKYDTPFHSNVQAYKPRLLLSGFDEDKQLIGKKSEHVGVFQSCALLTVGIDSNKFHMGEIV